MSTISTNLNLEVIKTSTDPSKPIGQIVDAIASNFEKIDVIGAEATTSVRGLMSSTDKAKLDGIAANANNYTHPANHPASIITQDASNRFVTDAEKSTWNAKQNALGFTPENSANKGVANGYASLDSNGLIPSSQLPSYVDDILEYVNLAAFPATGESGKIYVDTNSNKQYRWSGSDYRQITSGAVDSVAGKTGIVNLVKADVGLGNVDNTSDANKPISAATQTALDGKLSSSHAGTTGSSHGVATTSVNGFMSSTDKTKLDGIAANANNYTHPANHSPSIITQDSSNRFVTDAEKTTWNAKASTSVATTSTNGLMSSADKTKLDGVAANANNYSHPNHTGDVTSIGDGATVIANTVVTNAKLANVATATIKGRATAGTGSPEDLSVAQVKTILGLSNVTNNAQLPIAGGTMTGDLTVNTKITTPEYVTGQWSIKGNAATKTLDFKFLG